MDDKFDVVVIGAGPGGYVAAIRAAQLGLKTGIVEREYIGGVCLNWGCIPSKTLLYVSELKRAVAEASKIGLKAENVSIDLDLLRKHKDSTVKRLTGGVKLLLEKAGVTILTGKASFVSEKEIEVYGDSPERTKIVSDNFIIATGTTPIKLPMIKHDGKIVIGAREAIDIPRIPKNMGVIGAGPIGMEMASVYNTLGAKVTVIEMLETVLPSLDKDIVEAAAKAFKKQGLEVYTSAKVKSSETKGENIDVVVDTKDGEKTFSFDMLLVAAGMKPNTADLNLHKAGVKTEERGFVITDHNRRTNVASIFAIGDVAGGMLLAHKASHEGIVAAEAIAGHTMGADWKAVPYAVFTDPEIAGIGITEQEASRNGREVNIGKFPYRAVGKAIATQAQDGFVKVITDKKNDEILGIHMFGPHSGDIIYAGTALMEFDGTAEDLGHIMAIHPTLSEALMEAGLNANKRAIHIVN